MSRTYTGRSGVGRTATNAPNGASTSRSQNGRGNRALGTVRTARPRPMPSALAVESANRTAPARIVARIPTEAASAPASGEATMNPTKNAP